MQHSPTKQQMALLTAQLTHDPASLAAAVLEGHAERTR
jgi:hypothetical protein